MTVLKLWVSYLLLACAITGLTAATSLSLFQFAVTITSSKTGDGGISTRN